MPLMSQSYLKLVINQSQNRAINNSLQNGAKPTLVYYQIRGLTQMSHSIYFITRSINQSIIDPFFRCIIARLVFKFSNFSKKQIPHSIHSINSIHQQAMTENLQYLSLSQTMPLLNPQYPPQYLQKFTQLKKHIQLNLFNPRANQLAQELIPFGQTNYNCWYVKKMCFLEGVVSFEHEMHFSEQTLYEKIKNFQLWEHRRFLLQHNRTQCEQEYQLINAILEIEPKNYHAWSHRIWILEQVKNYVQELQFTGEMLGKDPFNNSVWAYRSYLVTKLAGLENSVQAQEKIVLTQVSACLASLQKHLNNQAAWNYLRGYFPSLKLKAIPCTNNHLPKLPSSQIIEAKVIQFLKLNIQKLEKLLQDEAFVPTHFHLQAQVQLLVTLATLYSQNQDTLEFAKNTCSVLTQKDQQKRFYWKWVAGNL